MGNKKVALKVENISIRFNLSKEKVDNLKELIIKKLKGQKIHFNEFWALKNINFELQKGDRLGILGLNVRPLRDRPQAEHFLPLPERSKGLRP